MLKAVFRNCHLPIIVRLAKVLVMNSKLVEWSTAERDLKVAWAAAHRVGYRDDRIA